MYVNQSAAQFPYGAYGAPQQQFAQAQPMWQPQPQYYDPNTAYGYAQGSGVIVNPCLIKGISTTSKEDDELLKNSGAKAFQITALDMAKARCNHKDNNGNIKIEMLDANTSYCRCTKCGKEWHLIKPSEEVVQQLVDMFLDLFQSIKTSWLTPPKEFAEQVYVIQSLIEKVPEMYKAALRDWTASENQINNQIQPGYAGSYYANGFQGIPQIQQGFYGAYQQPPVQQGGYQFMQPNQPMNNSYYQQTMAQPMPVGGNMMAASPFVQGGVVPNPMQAQPVPVQQAIPQFMQPPVQQGQQTMAQPQQQAPVMNIPQPGAPISASPASNIMTPPQAQPTQVTTAQVTL